MLAAVVFQDQVLITVLGDLFQNIIKELAQGRKIVGYGPLFGDERVQLTMPARA